MKVFSERLESCVFERTHTMKREYMFRLLKPGRPGAIFNRLTSFGNPALESWGPAVPRARPKELKKFMQSTMEFRSISVGRRPHKCAR